jgi:tetratricopeptide (TPR) repeat protein
MGVCTLSNGAWADDLKDTPVATFSSPLSYEIYNILAAEMYVQQGNPGQAALHYIAAAQQAKDVTFAQRAAELAVNANDTVLVSRALALWAQLDPGAADTRSQLALASLAINANRFEEALKAAQSAKRTGDKAQRIQASRFIAQAYMGLEDADKAIRELEPVVKNTNDLELKLDYGRMLILTDRRSEATPLYKQLYSRQPENSDVLYTLGLLYLEQKKFAFAEPLIKKLQQVPERAADASYFMGQVYEGQKRPKEAVEAYKQAVHGSFSAEATRRAARLLMKTDSLEVARQWLGEQLKAANNDIRKVQVMQVDGKLLYSHGQYVPAVGIFDQILALMPEDVDALYNRSLCKERLGDFTAAEADLRSLIKLQPDNATVMNALGYMLVMNTTRYPEAEELIRQALAIQPKDGAIMDSMGWVLFRSGKLDEAESWLRKAYSQSHEPEIASHLIEVLSAKNKAVEAKAIFQEILSEFPDDQMLIKLKEKLVGLQP